MCGRSACTLDPTRIKGRIISNLSPAWAASATATTTQQQQQKMEGATDITWIDEERYTYPMFNATLTHYLPVLMMGRAADNGDGLEKKEKSAPPLEIQSMRWGLIPHFAKDTTFGNRMANARCETLLQKPSFRGLVGKQRGILLVDGFYEWQHTDAGRASPPLPYYIRPEREDSMMYMAVLFDRWTDRQHQSQQQQQQQQHITSFTVITMGSDSLKSKKGKRFDIHHCVPAIFTRKEDILRWLDTEHCSAQEALALLREQCPYSIDSFFWYRVSTFVNKTQNNAIKCILPLTSSSDDDQASKRAASKVGLERFGFTRVKKEAVGEKRRADPVGEGSGEQSTRKKKKKKIKTEIKSGK